MEFSSEKLRKKYRDEMVMEWYEAYINFVELSEPLNKIYEIYNHNHEEVFTHNH